MRTIHRGWIQVGECPTRGVARITIGLKPSRYSLDNSLIPAPMGLTLKLYKMSQLIVLNSKVTSVVVFVPHIWQVNTSLHQYIVQNLSTHRALDKYAGDAAHDNIKSMFFNVDIFLVNGVRIIIPLQYMRYTSPEHTMVSLGQRLWIHHW